MDTVLGILSRPGPLGHCRNTPACTSHAPRMYLACTSQSPPNPLPITWLVPDLHLALGGFAKPFIILHSSFFLRPRRVPGSLMAIPGQRRRSRAAAGGGPGDGWPAA